MKFYPFLILKREIEQLLLKPFIWIGKWQARKRPLDKDFDLVCFFTSYGVGGAEKVNADVLACFPHRKILVLFCKKATEDAWLHRFQLPHVTIMELGAETDKAQSVSNFIARGRVAGWINRQEQPPVVFIGQTNFGYKTVPYLHRNIRVAELVHTADRKFAWVTFPYLQYLDHRVMLGQSIVDDHIRLYREIGIPEAFDRRIHIVCNKVDLPATPAPVRSYEGRLKVYYAGRGGAQKRLWLLMAVIRKCLEHRLPIDFYLAGSFRDEIPGDLPEQVSYLGNLKGGAAMQELHRSMDVLLMTPAFEGFPMVVMEAMINGAVPVLTAVDVIPEHIRDGRNGFLIDSPEDEVHVIEKAFDILSRLAGDRSLLPPVSAQAQDYAARTFSEEEFCKGYAEAFNF